MEVLTIGRADLEQRLAPTSVQEQSAWRAVASRLYGAFAEPARPLPRHDAPVFAVGSTTLGGGGKTPFVRALAASLSTQERPVAIVTHGYRATARGKVQVHNAHFCDDARYLAAEHEHVYSAPTRAEAFAAVPRGMPIVLDGALARETSGGASLLLHDATTPIRFAPPPAGPLRARLEALYAAADVRLYLGDERHLPPDFAPDAALASAPLEFDRRDEIAANKFALVLVTALARPERVVDTLAARGIVPQILLKLPDHGPSQSDLPRIENAVCALRKRLGPLHFLATKKCNLHLNSLRALGYPVTLFDRRLVVPAGLLSHLRRLL